MAGLLAAIVWLWASYAPAAEIGTVLVSDLNVRSGPGRDYRVLIRLSKGTQVRVLSRKDEWLMIEHLNHTGFIRNRAKYISVITIDETNTDHAFGQDIESDDKELKEIRQEAETIHRRVKKSEAELTAMANKEQAVIKTLNSTERSLDRARRQVRTARSELDKLQKEIDRTETRYAELDKEIRASEDYASQRIVALYKLHWVGRVHVLATANSFFDFINRKSALERILSQDEVLLDRLHDNQTAIIAVLEQLNASRAEKRSLELALGQRVAQLSTEQDKRSALLETIRSEKAFEMAALEALKQAARELDVTVKALGTGAPHLQTSPPKEADEKIKPFAAYKGLLSWPVKGKIISFYGPYRDEKYNVVNFQSGINIQAERGEPIRAVSEGYAIYSNWFKGFGNMLIIDHGDHYYTVYAHLEEVFKVKGDRVDKGEVVATVGDSGSLVGPTLHFEVRHHGKPMDPLKWINKG